MASAGVGFSTASDPKRAAEEVAEAAAEGCADPSVMLAFASVEHGPGLKSLLEALRAATGSVALLGATAAGVVGAGREAQGSPGLAALTLSGFDVHPFLVPELGRIDAGGDLVARIGATGPDDLVVLLPDPAAFRAEALLETLRDELGDTPVVGAGAVADARGVAQQWCGDEVESGALAGLVVRGSAPPRVGVTQACRPVTEVHRVTRSEGNWILAIDGRPALDLYREAAGGALARDLRRAAVYVLAAFPRAEEAPLAPGRYLVRHLVGFAERDRALAVPERVEPGDPIAFVHREPETARADLKEMLALMGGEPADCGLWLDCCARGAGFFGVPGLEAAYLEQALGTTPLAGMFGSCEIGPVAGRTELLTYTGVLALIR